MQIPLVSRVLEPFESGSLGQFKESLKTMKRLFPSLNEVIGDVVFDFNYEVNHKRFYTFINLLTFKTFPIVHGTHINKHIKFLVDNIKENVKPDWLPKLKIIIKFVMRHRPNEDVDVKMNVLQRIIDDGVKKSALMKSVSLRKKAIPTFDWSHPTDYHKLIEISTEYADFQIIFETCASLS
jgi:hypothetical protein